MSPDAERPLRALVTLDGSELSEAILAPVIQLVEAFAPPSQARLHLLHVVDTTDIAENFSESVGAQIIEQTQQQAREYLDMLTNKIRTSMVADDELPITCAVVPAHDVAAAIIRAGESIEDAEGLPNSGHIRCDRYVHPRAWRSHSLDSRKHHRACAACDVAASIRGAATARAIA